MQALNFSETISERAREKIQSSLITINQLDRIEVFNCSFFKHGKLFISWNIALIATEDEQHNESIMDPKTMKLLIATQGQLNGAIEEQYKLIKNLEESGYKVKFSFNILGQYICPERYIEEVEEISPQKTPLGKPIKVHCDRLSI
ncbi:MAG: hypothetical protein U5L10_02485 [Candidatus Moranbacteria bacterium]|nr:hypothetical protein [Candidatus Moranbacteria bacterium]